MGDRASAALTCGGRVEGDQIAVARAVAIDRGMAAALGEWVAALRARGVTAAHPDDGWVDRPAGRVHLCYPDFNDGLAVGGLLALGSPWGETRVVRVTGTSDLRLARPGQNPWWFHFEASDG